MPQPASSKVARRRPVQAKQATMAARRYFLDGWTLKQIGEELGVSRFKAARLLEWAKAEGIVRIEVLDTAVTDIELSTRLQSAFSLRDALVVAGLDGRAEVVATALAEVAAQAFVELVTADDVIGVSWGRTLDLLVQRLPAFRAQRVVQLIGGLATLESASGGVELVRQLAAKARASAYPLLAPVRLRGPSAAEALRADPLVAETLALIDEVTVVIAGVGSWSEPAMSRMIECFDPPEVEKLRRDGVVADLCGLLFTEEGQVLRSFERERVGITFAQLGAARTVVVVSGGSEKRAALAAILRSGLADIVITDAGSARYLLE